MDITPTIAASSDQINADDLLSGPMVVRVAEVRRGQADQPVDVALVGHDRVWRPCKTVRRILAHAWGTDTAAWVGRSAEIYRDPTVQWAGKDVGGIRVRALSHIDRPIVLPLQVRRGQRVEHRIGVLKVETPTLDGLDVAALDAWLVERGRPVVADLDDIERGKLAAFLAIRPGLRAQFEDGHDDR